MVLGLVPGGTRAVGLEHRHRIRTGDPVSVDSRKGLPFDVVVAGVEAGGRLTRIRAVSWSSNSTPVSTVLIGVQDADVADLTFDCFAEVEFELGRRIARSWEFTGGLARTSTACASAMRGASENRAVTSANDTMGRSR